MPIEIGTRKSVREKRKRAPATRAPARFAAPAPLTRWGLAVGAGAAAIALIVLRRPAEQLDGMREEIDDGFERFDRPAGAAGQVQY